MSFQVVMNGTRKSFKTGVRVRESDISANGRNIKNHRILSMLEKKRLELLDRIYAMELKAMGERTLTADWVVEKLLTVPQEQEFFAYADNWLSRCTLKGKRNYATMLNRLERFLGKRYLPFASINFAFLSNFEKYLARSSRAQSLYLGALRHLFREAMREMNTDYEKVIHDDPFVRYVVPKQPPRQGVRALELDELLRIYNYKGRTHSRAQLARDCFVMSFCLMGMNAADLYDCIDYSDGKIKYDRVKTRSRRADNAHIEVDVHPILKPLMKRYAGASHVFNFSGRFATPSNFNCSLNRGLKEMGKEIGLPHLQFYQARHTFATLSRNLMRFPKSDVDEALNHIGDLGMADVYIKKDFSIINDNNRKLIEEVFKDYL